MQKILQVGDIRNGYKVIEKSKRKKILLLSDDMRIPSGIGTMSKEIVFGTSHIFNWVQVAGAMTHPDKGKYLDISEEVKKQTGVQDPEVRLYPVKGYGTQDLIRNIMLRDKPDAILHYTDPRFWDWLYQMENEVRQHIPIFYYNIWDCPPPPYYNKPAYMSDDLIMNISKQTHGLVKTVLGEDNCVDLEAGTEYEYGKTAIAYVPHGIDEDNFKPLKEQIEKLELVKLKEDLFKEDAKDVEFIMFFNNRNIRRKMIGDIILAFQKLSNTIKDGNKKLGLVLHTSPIDDAGGDIVRLIQDLAPEQKIVLSIKKLSPTELNKMYNLADVTINIASNEGFGLTTAESLMAGTPVIINVTGGLQDQCGFKKDDKLLSVNEYGKDNWYSNHAGTYMKHGSWVKPVFAMTRSLQGSIPTPYILDDRADWEDVAQAMMDWYKTSKKDRDKFGLEGREFMLREDTMLSAKKMSELFIKYMGYIIEKWTPQKRFTLTKIETDKVEKPTAIIYKKDLHE